MPLHLTGSVKVRLEGDTEESVIQADSFDCVQAGLRLLGINCSRHEFIYRYDDPRYELVLEATAVGSEVELAPLRIEKKAPIEIRIDSNSLAATFAHDPDLDDEPLTPASTS